MILYYDSYYSFIIIISIFYLQHLYYSLLNNLQHLLFMVNINF